MWRLCNAGHGVSAAEEGGLWSYLPPW